MPMTEPWDVFFNEDEHATAVTINGAAVVGIFQRGYIDADGVASRAPTFAFPLERKPDIASGMTLVVPPPHPDAGTYTVRPPEPDGTGLVLLPLQKVA